RVAPDWQNRNHIHLLAGGQTVYRTRLALAVLALAVGGAPAWAFDLDKVERTIAKEPAYQGKPKYCLLVFGPEARGRCWLVQDGDTLYVDRNCNGDLTEAGKRVGNARGFCQVGDIREPDGKTKHTHLQLTFAGRVEIELKVCGKHTAYAGTDPADPL